MTMYDHSPDASRLASRASRGLALLAISAALLLMPPRLAVRLKQPIQAALRPGQWAASAAGEKIDSALARVRGLLAASDRHAELERQIEQLRLSNAQLQAAVVVLAQTEAVSQDSGLPKPQATAPLIAARLIEARVIGRQLQSLLSGEATLARGAADGIRPAAWVLDATPSLIDQGTSSGVSRGSLVLAARRVLGKIAETTRHTSRLQHPNDAGYRDLVQLAYRHDDRITLGPRGVLEGTGEPLCRIRLVPVTESVSVGDVLLTTGGEGIAAAGLLYGEVVRVEHPAGATHWDIWMQPAVGRKWPDKVAVVSASINTTVAAAVALPHADAGAP